MSHHPERTARNVRPVNQPPSYLIVKGELGGGWKEFRPTQKEIPCNEDGPKAYLISKKE